MTERLIRHFALLRKATAHFKDAMRSALSRNLLDEKHYSHQAQRGSRNEHLCSLATALEGDGHHSSVVHHLGPGLKLRPLDAGVESEEGVEEATRPSMSD